MLILLSISLYFCKVKSWMKQVSVNDYPIEFKLDTGSETNILPSKYLSYLNPRPDLKKSNVKLEAYGGCHIFPKGSVSVLLETKDRIVEAEFLVVDLNSSVPILGLNTCVDLDLVRKVNILLEGNHEKSKFVQGAVSKACPSRRVPLKVKEPLISHDIPKIPFFKVGVDIAHWAGKDYLVLVDYYTRWIEIRIMSEKRIFCVHGIPAEVFCDKNPFSSYEIRRFASEWNFTLRTASPNHAQSRAMVGKAVGIVKDMFKKSAHEGKDINLFLLNYRNSPVAGFPWPPAQLLYSRQLRSKLPVAPVHLLSTVVDPVVSRNRMLSHQNDQELWYNRMRGKQCNEFYVGESVLVRNVKTNVWERGIVVEKMNFRLYMIRFENGRVFRRNSLYIRKLYERNLEQAFNEVDPDQSLSAPPAYKYT
uniref:Uncharacterized protein K02A2.6 n=1 Tax=Cacopsylla melanoneura TaxID=428564 RepID=A0A8D8SYR9_9HEMI